MGDLNVSVGCHPEITRANLLPSETPYHDITTPCDLCRGLISQKMNWYSHGAGDGWYDEHLSYEMRCLDFDFQKLQESATLGCVSCQFLTDAIVQFFTRNHLEHEHFESSVVKLTVEPGSCPLAVSISSPRGRRFDQRADWQRILEVYTDNGKNEAIYSAVGVGTHISGDTSATESFHRAKEWLETCREFHDECKLLKTPDFEPPTRLLDLQCKLPLSKDIRLCEIKTKGLRYASLSHCWGKEQPIRTTSDNIKQSITSISWNVLPRSFQDAITMARYLGFRYLWIDSICIIQDSEDDWSKESARMAEVYTNSSLTLAVSRATNSAEGAFVQAPKRFHGIELTQRDMHSKTYVREKLAHCYELLWRLSIDDTIKLAAPLLQRGWFYQERLLSRRVLHFCNAEIYWECLKCMRCECGRAEHTDNLQPVRKQWKPPFGDKQFAGDLLAEWYNIVRTFSAMTLSYGSDCFPALTGLAKQFQDMGKGGYVSGLWIEDLRWGLTWKNQYLVNGEVKEPTDPTGFAWRAPTWSWASTYDSCWYSERMKGNLKVFTKMRIEGIQSTPKYASNTLGEITNAILIVSAPILKVIVTRGFHRSAIYGHILTHVQPAHITRFPGDYTDFQADGRLQLPEETSKEVFAMQIQELEDGSRDFLVLNAIDGHKDTYERVGYLEYEPLPTRDGFKEIQEPFFDELLRLIDEVEWKTITLK